MRVLMICTVPFMKNGISKVILNIASNIDTKKAAIDILSINKPDADCINSIHSASCKIYHIPREKNNIINYVALLARLIKRNNYDVIHIHTNSGTCILELLACKFANSKKIVVHGHNSYCKYLKIHKVLKPIVNSFNIRRVACSEAAGRFLFGGKPFWVFNNAIDTQKYRFNKEKRKQIREELGITEKQIVLGHIGVFNYQKNHEFLIEVFKEYHSNVESKLILIGDGENKERIHNLIEEYGIENDVLFTGNIDNVDEYLSAIDYFVLPSRFEGLPLVLIEAQTSGLKCYVSDVLPREANVGRNVVFIPLGKGFSYWSKQIPVDFIHDREEKSRLAINDIISNGYEMKNEIDKLIEIYRM